MSYEELIEKLLSDNVYDELKHSEVQLFKLIPELKICKGFNQNNQWHIYDVYEHILHVVSEVDSNICLRLSALFHDIGKPLVYTEDIEGIGHFYNHWNKSIEIFKRYQNKFELSSEEVSLITYLIFYHDIDVDKMNIEDLNILLNKIGKSNISLLFSLKRADILAQAPEFHYLLSNLDYQQQKIEKIKKYQKLK